MADVPFYLQGSQTGGLLQNLNPLESAQQAQLKKHLEYIVQSGQDWGGQAAAQLGTLSSYPGANLGASNLPSTATSSQPYNTPTTTSDPWMSLNEMRAATNALSSNLWAGGGSGGGGGGAGGGTESSTGGTGAGLNISNTSPTTTPNNQASNLSSFSTPISAPVAYQNPGNVNNTPTMGYQGPGGAAPQGQQGMLQMQNANPQSAMNQFQNSLGNQLLNSPNAYQQSPGYQYAVNQALQQVQQNAAAHGLLDSGAALRAATTTAQGLAQQDYGNWWNRQNQLYTDYQNRLQGLAGGPTGSQDAMTTNTNLAQGNLQTGSNLGSLFGNQGTAGMGGIVNTGAAQSGNIINAGQQQAQVGAANSATQLAGATLANQQQQKASGLF